MQTLQRTKLAIKIRDMMPMPFRLIEGIQDLPIQGEARLGA